MQARYYDPVIGRFYSNDPVDAVSHLGGAAGIHGFNRYAYGNNNPSKFIDPTGMAPKFVDAIKEQVQVIVQSFGYDSPSLGNQNSAADSMSAAKQVASDIGNATVDIASTTATVAGNVAADSLAPAATVSALLPGGQGISAALTVADVAVNGGLAEALGAASGATTSALVGDVLTDYGSKSPNLGVRVLSEATNQIVSRAAADSVNIQELKEEN
uniref:RHS repeat-associated core domain-containing protein n=1 Tax=Ningiella ruwaisensis TaxID=2364274 RepID=UPI00109F79CF|nr:RHS repeat-associated core domain-containing protein [Ningiella ruwaisensis]